MAKEKFNYRSKATAACPYPLETTPESHYVGASHKIVEIILINRFGKKNIPLGNFWRLADTSKQIYGAQKYLWPIIKRLQKTYDGEIIMQMVADKNIKFLMTKMIARYLYWCKTVQEQMDAIKSAKPRYNKDMKPKYFNWTCPNCGSVHDQDTKHCPCPKGPMHDDLDWIDS